MSSGADRVSSDRYCSQGVRWSNFDKDMQSVEFVGSRSLQLTFCALFSVREWVHISHTPGMHVLLPYL